MITTDRLFGEKVIVPPSAERVAEGREKGEVYALFKSIPFDEITAPDIYEKTKIALNLWHQANRREALIIAFEGDRVLCRLGNKLEWFHISAVELLETSFSFVAEASPLSN